jgi:hypothetical protein
MKRPEQLGRAARGRRGNSEYKKATRRAERRKLRQLKAKQLQHAPTKRRYLGYY